MSLQVKGILERVCEGSLKVKKVEGHVGTIRSVVVTEARQIWHHIPIDLIIQIKPVRHLLGLLLTRCDLVKKWT